MKKPTIGISGSIIIDSGGMFPGYKRAYVNDDYIRSVYENGGVPLVLPFIDEKYADDILESWFDKIDGLILSGGQDIHPKLYGEECKMALGEIWPQRDTFDISLLNMAIKKNIPILGVCRGFQLICALYGGKLLQDLSYGNNLLKHNQGHSPDLATQIVSIVKNSELYNIFGDKAEVNSFHHQVVINVGNDVDIIGTTSDGVIEAIEISKHKIWGVQWHPEMMSKTDKKMAELFKVFINKCIT